MKTMKHFPTTYALSLSLIVTCCFTSRAALAAEEAGKPNIILCMADDQGYGDVGYYGNPIPKTPVLDEMSRTGLRLDRFYAAAPVCSPTRGSVLTGRHPNRFACFTWGHTLRPQEVTVAEALKKAGYTTGHFGKWHLGSMRADSPVSPGRSGFDVWFSSPNFYENSPLLSHNGKVIETDGESSLVTVEKAIGFMRNAVKQNKPFLAVIWFGNPHSPHQALPDLQKLYPDLNPKLQNYYGEITGIDQSMGRLRKELRSLGIAENTLLWYTSDNGPQGPEGRAGSAGGLSGRKGTLWEGGIRVPTIIEWPAKIPTPRISVLPSGTIDIYPTLLDIAGVKIKNQPLLDGISLLPLIENTMTARNKPMGFWVYPAKGRPKRSRQLLEDLRTKQTTGTLPPLSNEDDADAGELTERYSSAELPGRAALIDGDYKPHRVVQKSGKVEYSLFNLADDMKEKHNLAEKKPRRLAKMKASLQAWQTSVIASLNGEDYKE